MRILVADQNAHLLAAITATFGRHCDLVTATRRDICLEHAEREKFDVVVACDKLTDYTGLELLSEMSAQFPGTLLILAASPARLKRLGPRLQPFGLFETISYPFTPGKLLEALQRARRSLPPKSARPVRHVVLESEWDTGERFGLIERELEDPADGPVTHHGWRAEPPPHAAGIGADNPEIESTTSYEDEGLVHGTVDGNIRASTGSAQVGFETEAALDDFVFAPPPPAPLPERTVAIEVAPSAVPVAQAAVELEEDAPESEPLTNDPNFEQPELPAEPHWAADGAANDTMWESTGRHAPSSQTTSGTSNRSKPKAPDSGTGKPSSSASAEGSARAADKRPKVRTPTQPTAAQLEAFQRARARRNAERTGQIEPANRSFRSGARRAAAQGPGSQSEPAGQRNAASWSPGSSGSLSDLARMAVSKRPLMVPKLNLSGAPPKRAVFVVGSGLAAVLIVGALFFELLRTPSGATEHLARAPVSSTPFVANSGSVAPNHVASDDGERFTPAPALPLQPQTTAEQQVPEQPDETGAPTTYPEGYDAYGNPMAPLPPPPVERPEPSEPPSTSSMDLVRGPPAGMVPPGFEPQAE